MKILKIFLPLIFLFTFYACATLELKPADFAWPIESVLKIDDNGNATETRYSFSFNAKPLFFEEMQDSLAFLEKELRVIRDTQGYYFITSNGFKNVYVFESDEGAFELEQKILISEIGIDKPSFNQRAPYIELNDGDKKVYLTKAGIERGGK